MKRLLLLIICCASLLSAQDWPREVESPQGAITIYQPQIVSFEGNALGARTAISIVLNGKDEPVFGAVWLDCRVSTDRTSRTVRLEDVKVRQIKFPSGSDAETANIAAAIESQLPTLDLTFSLDLLLESMETAQKQRENAHDLDVTPPKIIVMNRPAVLVLIDGDPVLTNVEGTSLKRVINAPYFLVQVPSGRFYLRGGSMWFTTMGIRGPWQKIDSPPKSVMEYSDQSKSDDAAGADESAMDAATNTGRIPEIVVSTEPAELIATDGLLQLAPINGTGLLYATNTPGRLFMEIATQQYFVLLSGRWYSAKALSGPWSYLESKKLPTDFAKIPPGSERDDVLASVPGTLPAKEAILDAQIPQTAEVDRETATTDVQYDGDPQFEPIENTGMEYAVNTPTAVLRVEGRYYNCEQGVWFESPGARGPWSVCVVVPKVIYTIPPRCPLYNVRYVRVYGYNRSVAYVGYTAGYTGCYVYGGTVVYGTGYHYRPWHSHYYYARPTTWGFGVHYDPWNGWALGLALGWGHPQGWFSHDPKMVTAGWWGPSGYRPVYRRAAGPSYRAGYTPAYRSVIVKKPVAPRPDEMNRKGGATRSGTLYDGWNKGVKRPSVGQVISRSVVPPAAVQHPPTPPEVRSTARPDVRNETRIDTRSNTRVTPPPTRRDNNVYAAPDGKVMRKTPQGWQQRDQNTWKDAGQAPAKQGVERESEVRQRAAERSATFKSLPPATPRTQQPPPPKEPAKRTPPPEKKKEDKKNDKEKEH